MDQHVALWQLDGSVMGVGDADEPGPPQDRLALRSRLRLRVARGAGVVHDPGFVGGASHGPGAVLGRAVRGG